MWAEALLKVCKKELEDLRGQPPFVLNSTEPRAEWSRVRQNVWFKDFIVWSQRNRVAVEGLRQLSGMVYLL